MKEAIGISIIFLAVWVWTTKPEDIGGFAGKVIHGFEQARQ
ncbi:hypothetical protein [Brucella anthropi]